MRFFLHGNAYTCIPTIILSIKSKNFGNNCTQRFWTFHIGCWKNDNIERLEVLTIVILWIHTINSLFKCTARADHDDLCNILNADASGLYSVKLLFTTICFVGFYSEPNLIVIIFNLLYPVCIVGFHCKGCVIERVVWRLKHLKTEKDFTGISRLSIMQSILYALHVLECEESDQMETVVSREYLTGKAFPRDTRETFFFVSLSSLKHTFCAYTIYTHIIHKCEESF